MVINDPLPANQLIRTVVVSKIDRGGGIFFVVVVGTNTVADGEGGGVRVIVFDVVAAVNGTEDHSAR